MRFGQYCRGVRAKNGRIAILARNNDNEPWVQVESADTLDNSAWLIEMLDDDAEKRAEYIVSAGSDEWGDDAPIEK